MSQNTQVDVFSDLIALQIGIIHPKIFKPIKKRRIVDAKIRGKAYQMIEDLDKCNDS